MASSYANLSYYLPSLPKPHFKTALFPPPLFCPSTNSVYNGISLHKAAMSRMHSKFEKFQGPEHLDDAGDGDGDGTIQASGLDPQAQAIQEEVEEEDDRFVLLVTGIAGNEGLIFAN